jgi:tRNA-splicing ligase RtcB
MENDEKEYLGYNLIKGNLVDVKMWTKHVPVESAAIDQLRSITSLPFVFKHVAAMPDVHVGTGSTVGTVLATKSAVIPAAVGVDIGCGMIACRTSLKAEDLPDDLRKLRKEIELMVPVGFDQHDIARLNQTGHQDTRQVLNNQWKQLSKKLDELTLKHPALEKMAGKSEDKAYRQLGSLGGGNHFIEICLDENQDVWIMLHSGSRGMGNIIGRYFIEIAQKDMTRQQVNLPHRDLAYLQEGSQSYDDYIEAVEWAQEYAKRNRDVMLTLVITAMTRHLPKFTITKEAVNSHHNYISHETHYGEEVIITRKGAVSAQFGQLGIIPGSMGAKSFIVRGLGNSESFCSCSHGAGRVMSRTAAKKQISIDDHIKATEGVECRKDADMIDESPAAYKDIDAVMQSQEDLVEIVHTLKQVLCCKG